MLKSGERSAQQLSQELGVSVWSLKRWSKEFWIGGQAGSGASTLSEPASALELARLRRELEFVTRQRDILSLVLSNRGSENLPNCSP
jgi:transposase-like protein